MNEVAVTSSFTLALCVLAAFGFSKVSYGTVLDSYLVIVIILSVLVSETRFGLFFSCVLDVNVSNHVFSNVVHHHHVNNLAVPAEFNEDLLVKFFKM